MRAFLVRGSRDYCIVPKNSPKKRNKPGAPFIRQPDAIGSQTPRIEAADEDGSQPAIANDADEEKRFDTDRIEFEKGRLDASSKYDKYLITLSSGALGLTILYMEKVASKPKPETFSLLEASWFFLATTVLVTVLSFLFSQFAWKAALEIHDLRYCKQKGWMIPDRLAKRDSKKNWEKNHVNTIVECFNVISIIPFAVGMICFILFACANLPEKEATVSKNITREIKPDDGEKRGTTAPPPRPSPPSEKPATKSEPATSDPKKKQE
jgi:hypothetical protein